jgi:predicted SnoaL-like aldol condensation-catalyzing enzyme
MKLVSRISWGWLALGALACASAFGAPTADEAKKQEMVMNWYREVVVFGHTELASKYMANSFVEHDPTVGTDLASFVKHYGGAPKAMQAQLPKAPIKAFTKGDYVTLVWEHDDKDPKTSTPYKYISYDVVRVKDGKIQEHWDSARVQ